MLLFMYEIVFAIRVVHFHSLISVSPFNLITKFLSIFIKNTLSKSYYQNYVIKYNIDESEDVASMVIFGAATAFNSPQVDLGLSLKIKLSPCKIH